MRLRFIIKVKRIFLVIGSIKKQGGNSYQYRVSAVKELNLIINSLIIIN